MPTPFELIQHVIAHMPKGTWVTNASKEGVVVRCLWTETPPALPGFKAQAIPDGRFGYRLINWKEANA